MAKRVLFVSCCHPVLEYDDLTLFTELGIDWFSTGIYLDPKNPDSINKRRAINKTANQELIEEFLSINNNRICDKHLNPNAKIFLTKGFVDKFDLVIVDKFFYYLTDNWQALKHKNVFWRTFFYSSLQDEQQAIALRREGLRIIRMYDQETKMQGNCPSDYVLPNYVDGEEYKDWNGNKLQTLTFQNDFYARFYSMDAKTGNPRFGGYHLYLQLIKTFPQLNWIFHGYNNRTDFCKGVVDWETQKQLYKDSRVYFSLGSKPGPYTYSFLEAVATGIPTINFGMGLGDCYDSKREQNSYILPSIIENGIDGYVSDNPQELVSFIIELYNNKTLADSISKKARNKFLSLFGKQIAKQKWEDFFKKEL